VILKKLIFCVLFLLTFTFETFSMDKITQQDLAFLGVNNITTDIDLNEDGFNEIILNATYFSYNSLADGAIKIIDGKKLFNLIQ